MIDRSSIHADARSPSFRIACVESASECIGILAPRCRIIGLTKGQFSMLDLLRAVIAQTGPANLALSTWTFGIRDIENAAWLLHKGDIRSLRILTDRSFATRQPSYCRRLIEVFGDESVRVSNTHAKFAILRNDSWNICIRGSMNLNRNKRWENFDLDDSAEVCEFFDRLIAELEFITPPGPRPGEDVVEDVFHKALETATCGDRTVISLPPEEHLARLGYPRAIIDARLATNSDAYFRGRCALEDTWRASVISASQGNDKHARDLVRGWLAISNQ